MEPYRLEAATDGHTGTIESTHAMTLLRGDGVTWALTVAGQYPDESTRIESIVNWVGTCTQNSQSSSASNSKG